MSKQNKKVGTTETATPAFNEREYLNNYLEVKEAVQKMIPGNREYVSFMVTMFPKYNDKKGRALLRSVYNCRKKDAEVLADFRTLTEKIKSLQQQ